MKKTLSNKTRAKRSKSMQPEYEFDYARAKPNRFAGRISADRVVVLLDPEVSKVFTDSDSVNQALRSLMPQPKSTRREAR